MGEVVQLDIFAVSTVDPPWRDNRDAMEYPFLSLQKGRKKSIEYRKGNLSLEVHAPVKFGLASIWDWDLIIFAASHLNDAIEAGIKTSPRIRFVHRELAQLIRRLRMTTVITNIRHEDDAGEERPFSWLADYSIPKRYTRSAMTPQARTGHRTRPALGKSNSRRGFTTPFCGGGTFSPFIPIISS